MAQPRHPHPPTRRRATRALAVLAALAVALSGALTGVLAAPAVADVVADQVNIPGDHQSALGCGGDWQADCAATALTQRNDGVWTRSFADLPAGDYEFKVAIDGSWDENYGLDDEGRYVPNSPNNVPYSHAGGPITFWFDPVTTYFWNTSMTVGDGDPHPVMTLPGDFQAALGCDNVAANAGNWDPTCMRTLLTDPDGDGIFTFVTSAIPPGSYETKVAYDQSWAVNYGADGAPGGANIPFTVAAEGTPLEFRFDPVTKVLTIGGQVTGIGGLNREAARWLAADVLAVPAALLGGADPADAEFRLHHAATGGIVLDGDNQPVLPAGAGTIDLVRDAAGVPQDVLDRFPHVAGHVALRIPEPDDALLREVLTGQLVLSAVVDDEVRVFTGLQIPGVLDDLYVTAAADRDLGVTWAGGAPSVGLWAPTAKDVTLLVWPDADVSAEPQRVDLDRHDDGSWTAAGEASWSGGAYRFEVEVYVPRTGQVETNVVTDPYSVGLTLNSTHSVFVDLADPAFRPQAWETTEQPVVRPVDQTIYEVHVRDFSWHDPTVPEELRGTFLAFAQEGTAGREHLRRLADAGLTTVHLLPTFDIATIEEDRAAQLEPTDVAGCEDLSAFAPDSAQQQACIEAVNDEDGFNWGYDPFHFNAPEGSYAVEAFGGDRVAEFRTMVGALHADGLQIVLDKVYNHTSASGQGAQSVFDRIVPGYYHRLNDNGAVETSTCCQNVATEHDMAEKFMVESVVTWARDYKVDGFRFDLMGHHSRANMEAVRAALDELTVEADGVDGSAVYLYGEGWNFGEVENNARFYQATQGQLGGTGIGTFTDRLRDAVRGGGPFDDDPRVRQGFGTGAFTEPNGLDTRSEADRLADARHQADLVRLGMAGNLREFAFLTSAGQVQDGTQLDYNGQQAGYADSPEEIITYVDKHDNETIFDILTLKLPVGTPMADRVRMNTVALSTAALSQTPAFFHAGSDLLRSKSLDRNSYNSGDWFNVLDLTGQDNGFARGLPRAEDNQQKWPYLGPLLANEALKPAPEDIATASEAYQDLLRLRFSTDLFRLGDADLIQEKVSFPGAGPDAAPGVVVMSIDDTRGADVDADLDGVLVVVNASPEEYSAVVAGHEGRPFALSPVQAEGSDDVVRGTTFDVTTGTVTVPARTVAVLVQPEGTTPDPTDPVPPSFRDVPPAHPFYREITWLAERGVVAGDPDGTFQPERRVSRQAMAAFLFRIGNADGAQPQACTRAPFPDVPVDHPFCGEIVWLVEQGIAVGYADGTFRPSQRVSRQAMAAFIARSVEGPGPLPRCHVPTFSDVPVGHPFCAEIQWMHENNLSTGYADGTYRPSRGLSRQAMAAFLYRLLQPYAQPGAATVPQEVSVPR